MPSNWDNDHSADSMADLVAFAEEHLHQGNKVYIGMGGFSKSSTVQGEIDNDEERMKNLGRFTEKIAQHYMILKPLDGEPGHWRARFGEAWLIRKLGLDRLINAIHGGSGRPPLDDTLGAVFVLVGK
jgi:hypothetical protein